MVCILSDYNRRTGQYCLDDGCIKCRPYREFKRLAEGLENYSGVFTESTPSQEQRIRNKYRITKNRYDDYRVEMLDDSLSGRVGLVSNHWEPCDPFSIYQTYGEAKKELDRWVENELDDIWEVVEDEKCNT